MKRISEVAGKRFFVRAVASTLALFASFPALAAVEGSPFTRPNWDHDLAAQTAGLAANRHSVDDLFALMRAGDQAALEARLEQVIQGAALSQPGRDYILFQFTMGLAEFDQVDPALLDRLRHVNPRAMVPHPESTALGIPLFNISAAAEGVYQHRLQDAAFDRAQATLDGDTESWLAAYLDGGPSEQAGYESALDRASAATLAAIVERGSPGLAGAPALTPVVGKAALLTGDVSALQQVAHYGAGAQLAPVLAAAGHTLPAIDSLALLEYAIEHAPASNASLAIAQIYPHIEALGLALPLMVETLAHPELGATAALALAAGNAESRAALQSASSKDDPGGQRARLALGMNGPKQGTKQ